MTWGTPGIELKPFVIDHRHAMDSVIDLSFLHEGPAGKDGFIGVRDGRLVTTNNGKPIHFWGFCLTAWSNPGISTEIPSKEDAPLFAAALSRYGVNFVRLHFLDQVARNVNGGLIDGTRDDSQHFDAKALDDEDFFIAELLKRGIYIDFNLFVGRRFKNGDNLLTSTPPGTTRPAAGRGRGGGFGGGLIGKPELFFDKRGIELEKDYARQWLTHVNPYTGRKYVDEPGMALVEIINEASIDVGYNGNPLYNQELNGLYNAWLVKTQTPATLARLREITGVGADQPIPRLTAQAVRQAPKDQYYVECDFYHDLKTGFFRDMDDYLKKTLGVKCLVMGTADHNHAASGYPITWANSALDLVDGHDYWQAYHPISDARSNESMLNHPLVSTIVELARTPVAGKPYSVSEMGHTWPNQYAAEGAPLLAAYGAFQGWDILCWYTWEWKRDPHFAPMVGDRFDSHLDPTKMATMAASAVMFTRGDIAQAKQTITRTYTRQQVWDGRLLPGPANRPWFTPGYPLSTALIHGVRAQFDGPPTQIPTDISTQSPFVSDTGQLVWDTGAGADQMSATFTVDAPSSQALVGFLKNSPKSVSNLAVDVKNNFCTVMLTSLTSKPIASTDRMLLVAAVRTENSGMQWDARRVGARGGESPTLIEPVEGTITLKNLEDAESVLVKPLDGAGHVIGQPLAVKRSPAGWNIAVGDPVTDWYEITVQRPAGR
ncbi:MAG TPA: hypothetical protein VHQ47_04350 [Phycisphaerae bacterium]|nr:hypothetical protein [Phycisphaerae bacterium]